MDEHRWKHLGATCVADRVGIKRGDGEYIVGGTICNLEILRLAGREDEMVKALSLVSKAGMQAEAENVLLRRERALLIELEKVRCGIIGAVAEGREVDPQLFRSVSRLNDALAALHLEASGGVQRPDGVPCACVLCRPEGWLRDEYRGMEIAAERIAAAHTGAPGKSVETRVETDRS